jgi:hypothetical protein
MLIHRTAKVEYNQANGDLVIQPGKMYKMKDFNDGERVGFEQIFGSSQTQTSADYNQKTSFYQSELAKYEANQRKLQKDDKGIGTSGILAIVGVISAVVIASIVVVRKNLNKKK